MAQLPENRPVTSPDEPFPPAVEPSPGLLPQSSPDLPPAPSADLLPPSSPDLLPPPSADLLPPVSGPAGAEKRARVKVPRTRVSAAWLGIWAGALALILLIVFVAQNTSNVQINFLWLSGSVSLAVALLVAGVGGAIIAMAIAAARIIQLRRLVRRGR